MKIRRTHIAIILSALFPGFGQIYNRQYNKGIFYICFKLVINLLRKEPMEMMLAAKKAGDIAVDNNTVLIVAAYTIADIILWILSVVDAKRNAEIIEKQIENKSDE
ncbi:MAG TPA: DUF5683 domain-containing protein [Thermodesulfobacteriota bacterium]|nr:DUF5683 domain-containing protein [Thermodesulfobacteriota bacterium]